ncbi:MAG TPA: hypothetical protein VFL36_00200 [Myxococcales bacterium]|nr:hypothetical protein [Myxococcales bacterium]
MRAAFVAILCSLPVHADGLDLELAPGWIWSTDISASAPVVRARAGYETRWLTPSVAGMVAPADPGPLLHGGQGGGIQGWGLAAELRIHTQGPHRLFAALGGGFGQLIALQAAEGDTEGYRGALAPYVHGAAGYRFASRAFRLGIELTLDVFNRVHLLGDLGTRICVDGGGAPNAFVRFCPTGSSFPMIGLALTLGYGTDQLEP